MAIIVIQQLKFNADLTGTKVVDKDSAVFDSEHSENIPLARDHHHLVRFDNANDDAYHTICLTLKRKVTQIINDITQSAHNGKII